MFTRNYYLANVAAQLIPISYYDDIVNQIRGINGELIPELEAYGDRKGGRTTISNNGRIGSVNNHMKKNKSDLILDTKSYSSSYDPSGPYGICFGNGNAPESYEDYNMSGELFENYTVSQSIANVVDDDGVSYTIRYTLTNTGNEDFTISEIGLFGFLFKKHKSSSYYYRYNFLTERTLLESPITIPANGGVGQVTYTLRYNYPTV